MQTTLVPPNGRDFDIYRQVKLQGKSTRHVAWEVRLSQTRVCQIVVRVGKFLRDVLPEEENDPQHRKLVNLAEQIAAERVDYLYARSLEVFEGSRGKHVIMRQARQPNSTLIKDSHGEARFLLAAGKFARQGATLPAAQLESYVNWEEEAESAAAEGVTVVEVEDDLPEAVDLDALNPFNPPDEACSVDAVETAVAAATAAAAEVASPLYFTPCANPAAVGNRPKFDESETVQSPVNGKKQRAAARRKAFLSAAEET